MMTSFRFLHNNLLFKCNCLLASTKGSKRYFFGSRAVPYHELFNNSWFSTAARVVKGCFPRLYVTTIKVKTNILIKCASELYCISLLHTSSVCHSTLTLWQRFVNKTSRDFAIAFSSSKKVYFFRRNHTKDTELFIWYSDDPNKWLVCFSYTRSWHVIGDDSSLQCRTVFVKKARVEPCLCHLMMKALFVKWCFNGI